MIIWRRDAVSDTAMHRTPYRECAVGCVPQASKISSNPRPSVAHIRILGELPETLAWDLAAAGNASRHARYGLRRDPIQGMLTKGSVFLNTCARIRDQYSFHIDHKPVRRWLEKLSDVDGTILQTIEE